MTVEDACNRLRMAGRPRTRMSPEEIALRHAGEQFRVFMRRHDGRPPTLRAVMWGPRGPHGDIEFTARFEERASVRAPTPHTPGDRAGEDWHWLVPAHEAQGLEPYSQRGERHFYAVYYRAFEDHMVELEVRHIREQLIEASRYATSPDLIYALQRQLAEREEHARRHHRVDPELTYAIGRAMVPPPAVSTLTMADVVSAMQAMPRFPPEVDYGRAYRELRDRMFGELYRDASQADGKAETLLKSWLSPSQLAQYAKTKSFEVIGSATGKRYRINHGRQMNIDEIDAKGNKLCGWCFLPQGGLVAGDCMLAQKIALETNETAALKVANKLGGGIDRKSVV